MGYVTYLLGAGASANALPLIGNMAERMDAFNKWMKWRCEREPFYKANHELFHVFVKNVQEYGTPDTYAKMLLFEGKHDYYEKFKDYLSAYLIFEQMAIIDPLNVNEFYRTIQKTEDRDDRIKMLQNIQKRFDSRYAQFLASIFDRITEKSISESKVRIITWNYDLQFAILMSQPLRLSFDETLDEVEGFLSGPD